MITRRRMIASLGGVALAAAGVEALILEPKRLEVTRHLIGRDAGTLGPVLRIVQISDLHLHEIGDLEERVAANVGDLRADVVVFTGDSVDRAHRLPVLRDFLSLLDPGVAKYAILGNWERWCCVDLQRLRSVYEAADCHLLVNESVVHEHEGAKLLVTGLDDFVGGQPDVAGALDQTPAVDNHLLLAHCPAHRDVIDFEGVTRRDSTDRDRGQGRGRVPQYVLSGHTHGGQVAFLGLAPIRPRGSGRYVAGWYGGAGPQMYVSRGLGWSGLPIRLGSVPEIALFEWRLTL